jgi:DNA-binding response OmpR family regulator
MPERDGWDVFNLMHQTHPTVPVIVITAKSQQHKRAADCGIDALMEKPLDLPLLLVTIAALLDKPATERIREIANHSFKTAFLENHTKETMP